MQNKIKLISVIIASVLAGGCTSVNQKFEDSYNANLEKTKTLGNQPITIAKEPRSVEVDRVLLPVAVKTGIGGEWLRTQKVSLRNTGAISLQEVFKSFAKDGINVVSDISLDQYSYTGLAFTKIDAETALKIVLGSAGLDFTVDNHRKLVSIKPLTTKTWYLNIGNRKASFQAGSGSGSGSTASPLQPNGAGAGIASTSNNGNSAVQTTNIGQQAGSSQITASEDFWSSIRAELETRLKPLMPEQTQGIGGSLSLPLPMPPGATAMPMQGSAGGGSSSVGYTTKTLGTFAVNPETGAVTVQAPAWILEEINLYLKKVQDMYNTEITFSGELISVAVDDVNQEGLDIVAFTNFLKNNTEGVIGLTTNSLGGATISGLTSGVLSQLSDKLGRNTSNLGATLIHRSSDGTLDGLQVLNAYLSTLGRVSINQKPVITTTSGVPGDFKRTTTKYYNTVSQQAAAGGTGSAAVGTQNQLVPIELGTVLRINPRMDTATGLIRAQITLEQTNQTGTQSVQQSLTAGDNLQQVTTAVPTISKIVYSGETLLKEGDLVVMGGQIEAQDFSTSDGITKLKDSPNVGGLFGKKLEENRSSVFYFALKVSTSRRK